VVDGDEVTRFRAGWERLVVDLASDTSSANTNHTECSGSSGTDASRTVRTWESTGPVWLTFLMTSNIRKAILDIRYLLRFCPRYELISVLNSILFELFILTIIDS
jgi:hypothetical protein